MRWQRWFLLGGSVYNAAWVAALLAAPASVLASVPPYLELLVAGVALEGLGMLVGAVRYVRWILALVLLGKVLGPLVFVALVHLGAFHASSWWLSLVNDVLWIPPLLAIVRGKERW